MWKLFILCAILTGPIRIKSAEDAIEGHAVQGTVHSIDKKRQELIPYPRMGRSSSKKYNGLSAFDILQKELEEKNKQNQRLFFANKGHEKEINTESDDLEDYEYGDSGYLLPYPRPGRQLSMQNPDDVSSESENMLPYPRFGKSLSEQGENKRIFNLHAKRNKANNKDTDYDDTLGQFLTPYPRIGKRSNTEKANSKLFQNIDFTTPYLARNSSYETKFYPRFGGNDDSMAAHLRFGRNDEFITPYPRLGRSNDFMTPYPRIGKRNDEYLTPYPRLGRSDEFMTPYPRMGRNDDFLTPYPRLGRSDEYMTPYPRMGRNDDFLTPYPRLGRSDEFITPYPRLGRNQDYITPYPRLGKRNSDDILLPYPRMGRSQLDSLENVDDQTDYLLPYPRPGKRNSIEDVMIPYPRLGKRTSEESILPYPRLGKSQKSGKPILSEDDDRNSPYITPYPRPGKSSITQNDDLKSKKQLLSSLTRQMNNRWQLTRMERSGNDNTKRNNTNSEEEDDDTITMIPNFRFGRSQNENIQIRKKRNSYSDAESQNLLPYPRLGRSSRFSSLARSAQLNFHIPDDILNKDKGTDDTATDFYHIPQQMLKYADQSTYFRSRKRDDGVKLSKGKIHKISLSKPTSEEHSSSSDYYILPYPRPGRTSI